MQSQIYPSTNSQMIYNGQAQQQQQYKKEQQNKSISKDEKNTVLKNNSEEKNRDINQHMKFNRPGLSTVEPPKQVYQFSLNQLDQQTEQDYNEILKDIESSPSYKVGLFKKSGNQNGVKSKQDNKGNLEKNNILTKNEPEYARYDKNSNVNSVGNDNSQNVVDSNIKKKKGNDKINTFLLGGLIGSIPLLTYIAITSPKAKVAINRMKRKAAEIKQEINPKEVCYKANQVLDFRYNVKTYASQDELFKCNLNKIDLRTIEKDPEDIQDLLQAVADIGHELGYLKNQTPKITITLKGNEKVFKPMAITTAINKQDVSTLSYDTLSSIEHINLDYVSKVKERNKENVPLIVIQDSIIIDRTNYTPDIKTWLKEKIAILFG